MTAKIDEQVTLTELLMRLTVMKEQAMHMKWNASLAGKTARKWYWDGQMDACQEILDLLK